MIKTVIHAPQMVLESKIGAVLEITAPRARLLENLSFLPPFEYARCQSTS